MKKLNFNLLLLLMGVLAMNIFTSCDDDDNGHIEITKDNIVGKWAGTKRIIDGVSEPINSDCPEKDDYTILYSSGTSKDIMYDEDCIKKEEENGTWQFKDNQISFIGRYLSLYPDDSGKWNIVNVTETYSIKSLTKTTMVIHLEKRFEEGAEILVDRNNNKLQDDTDIYLKRIE